MRTYQLILVAVAAFIVVLQASTAFASKVQKDQPLIDEGVQEIIDNLPDAAKEIAQGIVDAVNNGDINLKFLKALGKVVEVLLKGLGDIAAGALGD